MAGNEVELTEHEPRKRILVYGSFNSGSLELTRIIEDHISRSGITDVKPEFCRYIFAIGSSFFGSLEAYSKFKNTMKALGEVESDFYDFNYGPGVLDPKTKTIIREKTEVPSGITKIDVPVGVVALPYMRQENYSGMFTTATPFSVIRGLCNIYGVPYLEKVEQTDLGELDYVEQVGIATGQFIIDVASSEAV